MYFLCISLHFSLCSFFCQIVGLTDCLSVWLSVCLSDCVIVRLSVCLIVIFMIVYFSNVCFSICQLLRSKGHFFLLCKKIHYNFQIRWRIAPIVRMPTIPFKSSKLCIVEDHDRGFSRGRGREIGNLAKRKKKLDTGVACPEYPSKYHELKKKMQGWLLSKS